MDQRATDLRSLLGLTEDEQARCEFQLGDIRNSEAIRSAVAGIDSIIHLAAVVGTPACDSNPKEATSINVEGTRVLMDAVPPSLPFIYLSTCSVYGKVKEGLCRETDSVRPLTLYGKTKLISEGIVLDKNGVILRATTAYGASPHFRSDLIVHTFIQLGLTGCRLQLFEPTAVRPFIHITDIAEAIVYSIDHFNKMAGNIYNLGSDDGTLTKLDLAQRIGQLTGLVIELDEAGTDPDKRNYRLSLEKIQSTGYRTTMPFNDGLRETADWMRTRTMRRSPCDATNPSFGS